MEYCSCCSKEMTPVEVVESYLDQRIEQTLEVCGALSAEYGNAGQLQLVGKIADSLVQAATLTEVARDITEGEIMTNKEYDIIQLDTESNPELAHDISRLQDKIRDALAFYYKLRDKHGELDAWEMVEDRLCLAIGWADTPLLPIPEEEE
jgi:hypothetical protein